MAVGGGGKGAGVQQPWASQRKDVNSHMGTMDPSWKEALSRNSGMIGGVKGDTFETLPPPLKG